MKNYRNIVLTGMPGSGKTSIGRLLAENLNMSFCDLDEYIENKFDKSIKEIFRTCGERYFRSIESRVVREISERRGTVIATGGGTVLNSENMRLLRQNGIVFFINRPLENIISDIDASVRPLLANDISNIYKLYEIRYDLYKEYSDFEILNDREISDAVDRILNIVKTIE